MERNRLLAGRYRFLRLLPGRAKAATWTAVDEATGASVVASVWPGARVAACQKATTVKHERLAGIVDFIHKLTPEELPEGAELPKDPAVAVAEWLQGVTLHERLRTVRTAFESVQCVAQVASVIGALHDADCVHGGVSTRSVLLQRSDGGPTPAVTQVLVPPDGACFSPERVRGSGVSMQDDVWSLHVMLYMALTAQRPFTGGAAPELARAIIAARPTPLAAFDAGDDELQRVIDRGFGPVTKRMRRADELVADLNAWMARKRPAARPEPRPAVVQVHDETPPPSVDASSLLAAGQRYSRPDIGDVVNNVANLVRETPGPSMPVPYEEEDDAKTELVTTPFFEQADEPRKPEPAARAPRAPVVVSGRTVPRSRQAAPPAEAAIEPRRVIDAGKPVARPAKPAYSEKSPETPPPRRVMDSEPPTVAVSAPLQKELLAASAAAPPQPTPAPVQDMAPTPAMPRAEQKSAPEPLPEPAAEPPAPEPDNEAPMPLPEPEQPARDPSPVPGIAAPATPSKPPPAPVAAPPPRASRTMRTALLAGVGVLAAAAVALAAYAFFLRHPDAAMDPSAGKPRASESVAAPLASGPVVAPSVAPPETPSASAPPVEPSATAAPSAPASAPPAAAPAADATACIAALFPQDTFGPQPDLRFVCEEPDVRKGAARMRARIVFASHGALTQGMDEWSRLGWYELPVWATLRGACCGSEPWIEVPETGGCDPLGPSVIDAARSIVGRDTDLAPQKVAAFEKVGMCLQFQETKAFKYTSPPRSGGQIAFGKFMNRALARP